MISVIVSSARVRPGDVIRGTVEWQAGSKPPKQVSIQAEFKTAGRGHPDGEVVGKIEHEVGDTTYDSVPFEFTLPAQAPPTFNGNLFSIGWLVEARLDLPWARDETTGAEFVVDPV